MNTKNLTTVNHSLLIFLAVLSLSLLLFEVTSDLTQDTLAMVRTVDLFIALVFGIDFLIRLSGAKQKKQFLAQNWWQIIAAVPITASGTQALRGLMIIRLFQFARVASVLARVSLFFKAVGHVLKETHMVWISTLLGTVLAVGSIAFYYFEHLVNPYVDTVYDGFWFMSETMTNTGIGEVYPMTSGGRIVGILSMFAGAIIFGLFIAFVASYMTRKKSIKPKG